jgi:ribosomal protein L11 methyltransferase
MPYLALNFDLGGLDAERVEELCFRLGALSVSLGDARDDAVLEPAPGEVRLWPATRVQALFAGDVDAAATQQTLAAGLGIAPVSLLVEQIADRVWEREWLRDFHAMRFGRRLWICPHHESVDDPAAVIVRLDPGLAFGTGTHPSTALCLAWLDAQPRGGEYVIDYGCGSGVLGIAAAKLGAQRVAAFDIDPQALLATAENAERNAVSARLRVCAASAELVPGADVLLANILAGTLCELAPQMAALVRPGGTILLAGILAEQAPAVTAAYSSCFDIAPAGQRESWIALAGRRH